MGVNAEGNGAGCVAGVASPSERLDGPLRDFGHGGNRLGPGIEGRGCEHVAACGDEAKQNVVEMHLAKCVDGSGMENEGLDDDTVVSRAFLVTL